MSIPETPAQKELRPQFNLSNLTLSIGTHPGCPCPRFKSWRAKGKSMQVPSILKGKRPFDLITGGITGALLITAVGFNWTGYGFGWMLRGAADQMVIDAAVAAPIRVRIDSMQMMMNAKDLPTERYRDFTLVFD